MCAVTSVVAGPVTDLVVSEEKSTIGAELVVSPSAGLTVVAPGSDIAAAVDAALS